MKMAIQKHNYTEQSGVRKLEEKDRLRIKCQDFDGCDNHADLCEVLNWDTGHRKGISFFYFCDSCFKRLVFSREQRQAKQKSFVV